MSNEGSFNYASFSPEPYTQPPVVPASGEPQPAYPPAGGYPPPAPPPYSHPMAPSGAPHAPPPQPPMYPPPPVYSQPLNVGAYPPAMYSQPLNPWYPPPPGYPGMVPMGVPDSKAGLALTGMIVGIISLVFFWPGACFLGTPLAILGIVFSSIGLGSTTRRGMAIAGLICSIVTVALGVIAYGIFMAARS